MTTHHITFAFESDLTPDEADEFAQELAVEARKHLAEGERFYVVATTTKEGHSA